MQASTGVVDDPRLPCKVNCLKGDKLPYREYYADGVQHLPAIQVGARAQGPTMIFYPTDGIAQGLQIMGQETGAEVIGALLVYPNQRSLQTEPDQGRGLRGDRRQGLRSPDMATTTTGDKLTIPEAIDAAFIPDVDFPLPGFIRELPAWARVALILFILVVVSLFVRTRSIGQQFWMDEAITVGISSHHLSAIPGILRQDGSPPLFYLLLHFWMLMVGNGEAATHWLSEIFAVLTIPIGYWGGLKMAGKRAGLMTATLMAASAFLDYYSQETRMYALMTLLGLFGTIGFVRGFVFRERRYVILFSLSLAAMLYTHNWALFFGGGSVLSLAVLYRISGDEIRLNLIRDAIYAYVGAAILFVPWLPNFIFQTMHTAAPMEHLTALRRAGSDRPERVRGRDGRRDPGHWRGRRLCGVLQKG